MNPYLELVLIAGVTALAASAGTWIAGRWLQQRDEEARGVAAGRLVYLELSRNLWYVREFRKGGRASQALPFTSSDAWLVVQIDLARVVSKRDIATLVLPYSWLSTVQSAQQIDWLTKTYARLSGYERQWFDNLDQALAGALDTLGPLVWDRDQLQRLREAMPN